MCELPLTPKKRRHEESKDCEEGLAGSIFVPFVFFVSSW